LVDLILVLQNFLILDYWKQNLFACYYLNQLENKVIVYLMVSFLFQSLAISKKSDSFLVFITFI